MTIQFQNLQDEKLNIDIYWFCCVLIQPNSNRRWALSYIERSPKRVLSVLTLRDALDVWHLYHCYKTHWVKGLYRIYHWHISSWAI